MKLFVNYLYFFNHKGMKEYVFLSFNEIFCNSFHFPKQFISS